MEKNPFTPTFGTVPPFMAGRERVIRDIERGFDIPAFREFLEEKEGNRGSLPLAGKVFAMETSQLT